MRGGGTRDPGVGGGPAGPAGARKCTGLQAVPQVLCPKPTVLMPRRSSLDCRPGASRSHAITPQTHHVETAGQFLVGNVRYVSSCGRKSRGELGRVPGRTGQNNGQVQAAPCIPKHRAGIPCLVCLRRLLCRVLPRPRAPGDRPFPGPSAMSSIGEGPHRSPNESG